MDTHLDELRGPPRKPSESNALPELAPADSDPLRRRKLAVRAGEIAMAALIFIAAGTAPLLQPSEYTAWQLACLAGACVLYVLWNLASIRGIITIVLWQGADPAPLELRRPHCGVFLYFTVQLGLAFSVCFISDHGHLPNFVWLTLIPPVAFAVFFLEWRGITLISLVVVGMLVFNFHRLHDWPAAFYGGLSFSFAVLFTIVFSLLAVQSEKARNEVQRLAKELRAANNRLREYAVQAEELSAARERNRIAREIHDTLGHFLTVANVQLEAARALWSTQPDRAREAVLKAQSFTQEGLQDIRRSVASLRNSPLNNKPLAEALTELVAANHGEKPAATFTVSGSPRLLPPPVELSLYRAAQEGLTNTRKHSQASQVQVSLDFAAGQTVALRVSDDGIGAAAEATTNGFGLRGLRERAQLLGGAVAVETKPGKGFTLIFQVPA